MKEIKKLNYLNKLNINDELDSMILAIHDESRDSEVPIILDDGLDYLLSVVNIKKPKKILEIGTAVGFSAIMMARNSDAIIDSIERNQEMYQKAVENVRKMKLEKRIKLHFADALLIDNNELDKDYDIIFIDAAKAQNQKFFLKYKDLLKDDGIIITDNILFHGLVEKYAEGNTLDGVSKDLKAMVRKIHEYNLWLKSLEDYKTIFINIGDGIALTMRRSR